MNKTALIERCHDISRKTGIQFNTLFQTYFFESILKRISLSRYKPNFVFKGGCLLSSVLGLRYRSTIDIDFSVQQETFSLDHLNEMLHEIIHINLDDGITYEVIGTEPIRQNDEYGGFRIKFIAFLENIRQPFFIDLATGDPITPRALNYQYKTILLNEPIMLMAYNLETIIAEKFQTIVSKKLDNSRSKDFYDIFILLKLRTNEIDPSLLKTAIRTTFKYRKTILDILEIQSIVASIKEDGGFKRRWDIYSANTDYAKDISFEEVMESIEAIIPIIS